MSFQQMPAHPPTHRPRPRGIVLAGFALLAAVLAAPSDAFASEPRFIRNATSTFDQQLTELDRGTARWMRRHYFQMRAYPPTFDRLAFRWRPPRSSYYKDLYAIYNPGERDVLFFNPEWVLRDSWGQALFIPFGCSAGSCPQWAADVGNPEWQASWIAAAQRTFREAARRDPRHRGYSGIFIDDVNLELRVSYGDGSQATPFDPRSQQLMDVQAWQTYVADFVERVRLAFPDVEITHNPLWWLPHDDPDVQRQTDAADWIELERGFNDPGLVAGSGTYGYETFLAHVDWLHERGRKVVFEPFLSTMPEARYELANFFLVAEPTDAISTEFRADPPSGDPLRDWWRGWETDPGRPRGARELRPDGLWERRFDDGTAVVNPPGGAPATVRFRRLHTNLAGETAPSFSLPPRSGDVFLRD